MPEGIKQNNRTSVHGSTVCAIICKYMPFVHIYSIRIFNKDNLMTTSRNLIRALKWCLIMGIPIINLSLGVIDEREFPRIEEIVKKLIENEQIIISAYSYYGKNVLPASLKNVVGVNTDPSLQNYMYYPICNGEKVDFVASSLHRLIKASGEEVYTPLSTSYATPTITAAFARAMASSNERMTRNQLIDEIIQKWRIPSGRSY